MAADTAALVVALSAQLTKFEKDMKQAVTIADTNTKAIENSFLKMNVAIEAQVSGMASGFASKIGPLGNILSSLGPIGLGVAASFGAIAASLLFITDKVEKFAEKSRQLKESAETLDLTTTQLKALNIAGQQVGLDSEQTEKSITKLVASVVQLRTSASGPLFEFLLKNNQQLTLQLSLAKDTAEAIDILAAATKNLTEQEKQELNLAVFGRRNLAGGRLLGAQPEGGFANAQTPGFDPKVVEQAAKLRQEIEAIKKQTDDIWGRAFAPEVLPLLKSYAEFWLKVANAVEKVAAAGVKSQTPEAIGAALDKRIADLQTQLKSLENIPEGLDVNAGIISSRRATVEKQLSEALAERAKQQKIANDAAKDAANIPVLVVGPEDLSAAEKAAAAREQRIRTLTDEISKQKILNEFLGGALRPTEELALKKKELELASLKNTEAAKLEGRALEELNLKTRETIEATKERLGVATESEIASVRAARVQADAAKIGLDPARTLQAVTISAREAKDAADALQVRQAYLPGLKQLELDAANVRKGIDTLATQSLNTLADGFADVIIGTKSLADAFKSMTESILRDLVRLALRQSIIGPIAGALQGAFGAGFLSSGLASQNQLSGIGNAGWSTEGFGPGSTFLPRRQGGGPVSRGRGYIVGEHGTELFVPSSSGQVVPGSLQRGGSGSEIIINNYTAADSETKQTRSEGPNGERVVIDIIKKAQSRGEFDDVNRGRFGLRPAKVR